MLEEWARSEQSSVILRLPMSDYDKTGRRLTPKTFEANTTPEFKLKLILFKIDV